MVKYCLFCTIGFIVFIFLVVVFMLESQYLSDPAFFVSGKGEADKFYIFENFSPEQVNDSGLNSSFREEVLDKNKSSFNQSGISNTSVAGWPSDLEGYEISNGWTVTSYQNLNESLYAGQKVEAFDAQGKSVGFYREDFLEQVSIDGSGFGDGNLNSGQCLCYDYNIADGKTYYLTNQSIGSFGSVLIPWDGERPSVAVNPPLAYGTEILFVDLGSGSEENPAWVNALLKGKVFYADDQFYGFAPSERKIDVYVGTQQSLSEGRPESLMMRNVTVAIKFPSE